jgi:hypothetical protein
MRDERELSSSMMANNFVTDASSSAVPCCKRGLGQVEFLKERGIFTDKI